MLPVRRIPQKSMHADAFAARVVGTLLANYAIKQISPQTGTENWQSTAEEKPFVQNCPVQFSITHAGRLLGVAVSEKHPVGLDVEAVRPMREGFASRYFNACEQAQIRASADPDEALIRLWTAKEAVGKYHGTGLRRDIAAIDTKQAATALFKKNGTRYAISLAPKQELPSLEWVKFEDLVP